MTLIPQNKSVAIRTLIMAIFNIGVRSSITPKKEIGSFMGKAVR